MTICSSCENPKDKLERIESRVLPGVHFFTCNSCKVSKYEPRGFVILAVRKYGVTEVGNWIRPKRYCGEDILVEEIVV